MILQSAIDYFSTNYNIRVAHLIAIELAGTSGVYDYLTDYYKDISFGGITYVSGRVKSVSDLRQTQGIQNYTIQVNIAGEFQEEADKVTTSASYEGRNLIILKASLTQEGSIIPVESSNNGPQIFFKGKIFGININENITSGSSTIVWECSGSLRDFEKINGRVTDDDFHRGIVTDALTGLPVPSAGAKKPAYQTDYGFIHANQTITSNIKYIGKEKEYYLKKSWGGLKSKLREREVEVERRIELNTSLAAKYIPVVYGVRKVPGIPVFLDVDTENPSRVYCVYAVCEGEIDGFLDVYINGSGAICSGGASGSDGICMGDKTKGHTLSLYTNNSPSQSGVNDYGVNYREDRWRRYSYDNTEFARDANAAPAAEEPVNNALNSLGTYHGLTINVAAEGGAIRMTFYHGKSDQLPDLNMTQMAKANRFLVQSSTLAPDGTAWGSRYWPAKTESINGAALLDTAYVVASFDFSETRTELPNLEFVVSGKLPRVYTNETTFSNSYTLNPVWHILEYLTNKVYGGGISYDDIDIPSFISTASKLDSIDTSYDSSFVKQWRYVGWLSDIYPRTLMQTNTVINTENSVTKNIEELLKQFAGTINIISGKYHMSIEDDSAPKATIDIGEIVGRLTIRDSANKDKWNSIQASIVDPMMEWSNTQINFFNSEYLAEDNGIHKKGTSVFYNITNYYTARSWAKRWLDRSRDGKTYSFTTYFKFLHLVPNDNVLLNYPRLGLNNTKVRVTETSVSSNGLVSLVVETYNPESFILGNQTEQPNTSVTVPGTPIPQNLGFNLLPNASIPINLGEDPSVYGVLLWDKVPEALRYEIKINEIYLGSALSTDTVIVSGVGEKVFILIRDLTPNTVYQFKVLTVSRTGAKSSYALLDYTTGSTVVPAYIPKVVGLYSNTDSNGVFSGPDLNLGWDISSIIPDIDSLQLQILDVNNTLLTQVNLLTSVSTYSFSLATNKQAYLTQTTKIGAYRQLKPRIRAVAGNNYSEWSEFT